MQWSVYWFYCWVRNGIVYVFGSIFYVGLKFDRVSPLADLKTNVVVTTIVGVSPVVQPYITILSPYTFGQVGVAPICLPYTSVALPFTSVSLPYPPVVLPYTFRKPPLHFCKPPLDFCIPPLHYF
jgi:hypothetical protein